MSAVQDELVQVTGVKQGKKETDEAWRERLILATSDLADGKWKKLSKTSQAWAEAAINAFNEDGTVNDFEADDDGEAEEDTPKRAQVGKGGKKAAPAEDEEAEEEAPPPKRKAKPAAAEEDEEEAPPPKRKRPAAEEAEEEPAEDDEAPADDEADAADESGEPEEDDDSMASKRRPAAKAGNKKAAASAARGGNGKAAAAAPAKKAATKKGDGKPGALTFAKRLMAKTPDMTSAQLAEKLDKAGYQMSSVTLSTTRSQFRHTVGVLQDAGLLKKALIA